MADNGAIAGVSGLLGEAGISLPKFSWSGIGFWAIVIIGCILLAGGVAFGIYFLIQYLKWDKKIMLVKRVGNRHIPVGTDKAMFERIGQAGDYWLKTKKYKKTLPRPTIEMDKNTYWYFERSKDGEWINFDLGDIDEQLRIANVHFVDEDMRLQRLGIQKNLQARLLKETFWQKYGTTIMLIIFVLIVTISLVVLFQKMQGNWESAKVTAEAIEHMAESVNNMARQIGGGVTPAPA